MISGIIAEYNIFHNGHKYLIDEVKKHSDAVIAVISGSFVQRGDVAITDKWTRAKTALLGGCDLVIELPVCYALNAAPNFAAGGTAILSLLGADELAFGAECDDINEITKAAYVMENEPLEVADDIKKNASSGVSYAKAMSEAYNSVIPPYILSAPNNILAVEYCRAILRQNSTLKPYAIQRNSVQHDTDDIKNDFASASKIRDMIINNENITPLIPYDIELLKDNIPYRIERLDNAIISNLRLVDTKQLSQISEVTEGLENRIIEASMSSDSFFSLAQAVKSKRYTLSKIRRILIASLLGFTKDIYSPNPEYIRVLGMNKTGMNILKQAKKHCPVPIITKTADFKEDSKQFELDVRATNISALCHPTRHSGNMDFKTSPIILP